MHAGELGSPLTHAFKRGAGLGATMADVNAGGGSAPDGVSPSDLQRKRKNAKRKQRKPAKKKHPDTNQGRSVSKPLYQPGFASATPQHLPSNRKKRKIGARAATERAIARGTVPPPPPPAGTTLAQAERASSNAAVERKVRDKAEWARQRVLDDLRIDVPAHLFDGSADKLQVSTPRLT